MTTTLQPFKANDPLEARVTQVFINVLNPLEDDRDAFFEGAFESFQLGDVIFNLKCGPLAEALSKENFRQSFFQLYDFFTKPGTFEFYLDLCRIIWGDDVAVEFSIPSPGQLFINIESLFFMRDFFLGRTIVDNVYQYDRMVTQGGDFIIFQTKKGLKTQDEVDTLFKELSVAGVYTVPTLSV